MGYENWADHGKKKPWPQNKKDFVKTKLAGVNDFRKAICVNFCDGFSNEELERLGALRQLQFLGKEPNWKPFNQEDESTWPEKRGWYVVLYGNVKDPTGDGKFPDGVNWFRDFWYGKQWKDGQKWITKYMPIPEG